MLNLKKIAVSGGLDCGKSQVCRFLKEYGAYTVSCDEIVHKLLKTNTAVGRRVIRLLGSKIVNPASTQLNRSLIADEVFSNKKRLEALEEILHPVVKTAIENEYRKACKLESPPYFVVEVPLLFEKGWQSWYDKTLVVVANPEIVALRSKRAKEDLERRKRQQWSLEEKAKQADIVIENNENLEALRKKTYQVHQSILSL